MPDQNLSDIGEPTHGAILRAIYEHRAESKLRWENFERRLDDVERVLHDIPAMKQELAENTTLTKQYSADKAFRDGLKNRYQTAGILAGATAAMVGLWLTVKNLFSNGPPNIGPHP